MRNRSSLLLALPAQAQELAISANDTLQSVLVAQKGKRVSCHDARCTFPEPPPP